MYSNSYILIPSSEGKSKYFRLDPEFPRLLHRSGFASTIRFLQSLFEDYSKRGLSEPTDRAVALSGLATRIASALTCREGYGIFDFCLHRNLLWQRSDLQKKRIKYEGAKVPIKVPSWSWMAYEGGIEFIQFEELPYQELDLFNDLSFTPDKTALITKVWKFQGCSLNQEVVSEASRQQILDSGGTGRGWIMYDVKDGADLCRERSVVVGRRSKSREYHILVVRQTEDNEYEYKRVGIGMVQHGYISRQQPDIRIL
jgi:hypothetical protein